MNSPQATANTKTAIIGYPCPDWIKREYATQSAACLSNTTLGKSIAEKKQQAFDRIATVGIPTPKNEDWKYTSLSEFSKVDFVAPDKADLLVATEMINSLNFTKIQSPRLVFVNGGFAEELSTKAQISASISCSICKSEELTEKLAEHALTVAEFETRPVVALNTALFSEIIAFDVKRNSTNQEPILLLFVTTESLNASYTCPRVLIRADVNSQASFIECHIGTGDKQYLTNAVTEIVAEEGAVIEHYRLQLEGENAFHLSSVDILQAGKSNVSTKSYSLGGKLVRNEVNPTLGGEGIDTIMHGLSVLSGSQHVDNHTVIDHAKPHSQSTELYKGIYSEKSRGIFNGTIIVRPQAQKTNAIQSNQTLLLSEDAAVETQPQLKIWADDVRCTHGATIGQLSDDALFYLRSRGIDRDTARDLLVYGFASDLLQEVKIDVLRDFLEQALLSKLKLSRPID
jgi:Fe-S cluster assembly protein SufD